ncbi:MAG: two-component regulator propeller domain-containing protein [Bacteroidota bacterium]
MVRWFVFMILASAAQAQPEGPRAPVRFERATDVEVHLPQSSVYDMLEDRRGFLWFATREGLGRWDGTTMRTWRRNPFDPASLPGNLVRELAEDGAGDLWAVAQASDRTPAGIARLVGPGHGEVRRYDRLDPCLFIGPDREAWLAGADSLYRFDRARDRFAGVRARLGTGTPMQGLTARDGTVWVSTHRDVERYAVGEVPEEDGVIAVPWTQSAESEFGVALAEDEAGTLWVAGVGLARVSSGGVEPVAVPQPEIPGYGTGLGVNRIVPAGGVLWLGTLGGVYRYAVSAGTTERFSLHLPGGIPTQNWITGFHRDRAGTLWAGTVWGLHRAVPNAAPFSLLAHDPEDANSLGSGIVLSVHEDTRGALWVGTLGGGLNRIGPDGRVTRYRHDPADPSSLGHDWVWSVQQDGTTLWLGTGAGLDWIDLDAPDAVEHVRVDIPPGPWGPSASGLHLDAEGTLWFGHAGRLFRRFTDGTYASTPVPRGVGVQVVRSVPGGAWVTSSAGLLRYDAQTDSLHSYLHDPADPSSLSDNATMALHLDRRGRLWVGTQSGLDRYDASTGRFAHVSSADGLPSSAVYAILEDDDGRLWLSTNRGLARFDPDRPAAGFRTFAFADGVGNVEFNRHAAFRGRDGTLYFGGDRGVTVFHPSALRDNPYRPPVVLTALHRAARDTTTTTAHVGETVEIDPGVASFTFEFAALQFANAHRTRYAARLEGFDAGWVDLGQQRRATYTNLRPGRYTFRVKAANEDGLWNETGAAATVIVWPRFFQTWWFQVLFVGLILTLVGAAVWSVSQRRYRRELARLEARQALDAERARISRDMHDEVGASLSEIAILSELAQRDLDGDPGSASGAGSAPSTARLSRIADTSRAMLDAIGEIIWAINPQHDRLDRLTAYLREHAARTLDEAGLRVRLDFPAQVPPLTVSAEFRRNVFLVMKEALHNLVRHAGATNATVRLEVDEAALTLTVQDDGCGLPGGDGAVPRPSGRGGNGLANMAHRAGEIDGTLALDAGPDGGTRLTLRVPLGG